MDLKVGVGSLDCRLCGATFQMPIHHLHEPIDVFSEWLDECEAAAAAGRGGSSSSAAGGTRTATATAGTTTKQYNHQDDDEEEDDDDDIPEPSRLQKSVAKTKARPAASEANYSALGLDDSDDDDDDEED